MRKAVPSLLPCHTRLPTAISQGCCTPYKAFLRSGALQTALGSRYQLNPNIYTRKQGQWGKGVEKSPGLEKPQDILS